MKKIISVFIFAVAAAVMFSVAAFGASLTAGQVKTESGSLNLRAKPSVSSAVVGSVKRGSWLTVKGKSGEWFHVEYAPGKEAYVSSSYIKHYDKSIEAVVNISGGYLNVRSGADTTYLVKDRLTRGETVIVAKMNENWCGIVYKGSKVGYVARKHLIKAPQEAFAPVKLNVPSFKQTDSRWSSYPIGTTGGNIGTIGCTTTALAMIESYHTGATVTPPQMAKKLSYSAGGSLYWPSTHSVSMAGENYLSELYSLLKKGKPVVFGMKTAKGNQHWVVVYGFSGGNSLTADRFLIHDPGSSSRTTLKSVMSSYPYIYKTVYKK